MFYLSGGIAANAAVTAGSLKGTTDGYGMLYLCNAKAGERLAITVKTAKLDAWDWPTGAAPLTRVVVPADGETTAVLFPLKWGSFQQVDAALVADGGLINSTGASLTLPAGAFATLAGAAHVGAAVVQLTWFDAADPADLESFPGDFVGERTGGAETALLSVGFVEVSLFDAAMNPLQLAAGKTATLQLQIDTTHVGDTETEIPLWYFDEGRGTWIEEGLAQIDKANGLATGQVAHFSSWNVDKPVELTDCLVGQVQDPTGAPLAGLTAYGSGQGRGQSDGGGNFCLNFYPRASFNLGASGWVNDVIYTAVEPVPQFSGSRDGGFTCATTRAACNVLGAPVIASGEPLDGHCLNVQLTNTDGVEITAGQVGIYDETLGEQIFEAAPPAATFCLAVPPTHTVWVHVFFPSTGQERFCEQLTFNGTDVSGSQNGLTISDAAGNCGGAGCDSLVMDCAPFGGP